MLNWFCFRDIKNRGIRSWPYFWGKKTKKKQAASSVAYCAYPLNIFLYKFTLFSVRYVNNLAMYLMCRLFILYNVIYRPLWHKRRGKVVPNSSRKKLVNKLNKFYLYLQTRELRGCLNQSKEV